MCGLSASGILGAAECDCRFLNYWGSLREAAANIKSVLILKPAD
jgi:hypothetical protein